MQNNIYNTYKCLDPLVFPQVRSDTLETIKYASVLAPEIMYTHIEEWLTSHVKKTSTTGTLEKQLCNLFSPSYLEWDALSQVMRLTLSWPFL